MKPIQLQTGELEFEITNGDQTQVWSADLIELKLAIEQIEKQHELDEVDGFHVPTAEFLGDVADKCYDLGCPSITSTMAKQIWFVVNTRFATLHDAMTEQVAQALES